jgi:hypothetical protein
MLTFDAYSYRTSSRFGSRVKITIDQGMVTITGPRIGLGPYRSWITVQAFLLGLVLLALLAAVLFRNWWFLALSGVLLICHGCAGGFGAGCLWELENLIELGAGIPGKSACFPLHTVKNTRVGKGWARRGMWLLILPYIVVVDKMADGYCVSFEAPDGEREGERVYALHMRSKEEARRLAVSLTQGNQDLGKEKTRS